MSNLNVEFCGIDFKNPIITASGTFGNGREYDDFYDIANLGGITVKGIADKVWNGNPTPRVTETSSGMLNAIGLQNNGVDYFLENELEFLENKAMNTIVNICGHSTEEFINVIEKLNDTKLAMYELNVSCPNVTKGGIAFGTDAKVLGNVVKEVKKHCDKPLIIKLSPNVTDITEMAKACEANGADGISLINTLLGMQIDIYKRKTVLANRTGGLSGPAIKPVAIRLVNQVAKATDLPIIGMGGVSNSDDAIEFIMAGATLVAIGTANFINPYTPIETVNGIKEFMEKEKINNLSEIRGII
ncbi:MAG: dihydroorotate dehydrogenase [Lachnospirales bacterium]